MGGGREPHLLFTISLVRHFLSSKTYCLSFSPRSFLLATMSQLFRLNHRDSSMSGKLPWGLWCRRVTSLWPTGQTGGQLPTKQVCWVQGFWAGRVPSSLGRCYGKSLLIAGQTKTPTEPWRMQNPAPCAGRRCSGTKDRCSEKFRVSRAKQMQVSKSQACTCRLWRHRESEKHPHTPPREKPSH